MNGTQSTYKWLADILLLDTKYNQTIFDVATPLFPFEMGFVPLLTVHFLGTVVNAFLLTAMLMERAKRQLKIKILLSSLTLVHFLWSTAWLLICLTSALHPVKKIREMWMMPMDRQEEQELKELLWELVGRQTVDNLFSTIMIFFLAISLERYLNLLPNYDPIANGICCRLLIVTIPWLLAYTIFDHRLIALLIPMDSAVFCRLCLLVIPPILSFLLSLIACVRPARRFEAFSSLNSQLPILMFVLSLLIVVMSSAFFFRLLEDNFGFVIIMGGEYEDHLLTTFLDSWFWTGRCLVHLWALLFPLCLVIFVKLYREMICSTLSRLCCCCCRKKQRMDYSQETLRSIIGSRNLVSTMH